MDPIGQYQNNISGLDRLTTYDFENIFKVYFDPDTQSYYYNIANSIFFPDNLSQDTYFLYKVPGNNMSWNYLSYIHYGTISLWWLLCILNDIDDPMIFPEPGTNIKVLIPDVLRDIIQQIQANQ